MKVAERVMVAQVETIAIECAKCGVTSLFPVVAGTTSGVVTCGGCKATLKWDGIKEVKIELGGDKQKKMA